MMFPDSLYQTAGLLGVGLYLGSYALLQRGAIRGVSYTYTGMNLAASALVLVSLMLHFNLWSAIIQISWIIISLYGLARLRISGRPAIFTPEERALVHRHFASLSDYEARNVLDAGAWITSYHGTTLTRQGVPVDALYYIADGCAHVYVNGAHIAGAPSGSLIGEITCLSRDPATATTVIHGKARLFRLPADRLHTAPLVPVILAEMQQKLRRANDQHLSHREAGT